MSLKTPCRYCHMPNETSSVYCSIRCHTLALNEQVKKPPPTDAATVKVENADWLRPESAP